MPNLRFQFCQRAQVIGDSKRKFWERNRERKSYHSLKGAGLSLHTRMSGQQKEAKASTTKTEKEQSPQQIVEGFRKLRDEQQLIASKISELEAEKNEHKLV